MCKTTHRVFLSAISLGVALSLSTGQVQAQAIERHLPDVPQNAPQTVAGPNAVPADQDDRPIGPPLRAIHLLGPSETASASASNGVSIGNVPRLTGPQAQGKMAAALAPFLGRPITRKMVAEMEATIADYYRKADYPFVSLSTPEQEISTGALQIRVIEFKLGKASVTGAKPGESSSILDRIDLAPGDPINSRVLSQNLNWINQYPFRRLDAVFSPGDTLGTTDLSLQAVEGKPWQAYAGYTNDGTRATGYDRFFVGGAVGNLLLPDSVTAAQLTGSTDAVEGDSHPRYASGALTYQAPLGYGRLEAEFDTVETYQKAQDFLSGLNVFEGSLGYRLPLTGSAFPEEGTDVRFGVEGNHQTRDIYFDGTKVYQVGMNVWQLYLGLHQTQATWGTWDVALHVSPGGVGGQNSDAQALLYSQGRVKDASYAYLTFDYSKQFALGRNGTTWVVGLSGQFSGDNLPSTAQSGLGSMSLVRGYSLENGSFDSAVVLRNELRFANVAWGGHAAVSPYLFADAGEGIDHSLPHQQSAASVGAGLRAQVYGRISLNALGGVALARNAYIAPGNGFFRVSLSVDL